MDQKMIETMINNVTYEIFAHFIYRQSLVRGLNVLSQITIWETK